MNYGVKYSIVQTVVPAAEPVSAAEAKTHMNVTLSTDDTLIGTYITAARLYVEKVLGRQLITATYRLSLDDFPPEILLPYPPLGSITSITYTDTAGTSQTLASTLYQTNSDIEPCRVKPSWGNVWPAVRLTDYNVVKVTYTAGYGAAGTNVPADILTAIKVITANLYEFREDIVTGTIVTDVPKVADNLLAPYRMYSF